MDKNFKKMQEMWENARKTSINTITQLAKENADKIITVYHQHEQRAYVLKYLDINKVFCYTMDGFNLDEDFFNIDMSRSFGKILTDYSDHDLKSFIESIAENLFHIHSIEDNSKYMLQRILDCNRETIQFKYINYDFNDEYISPEKYATIRQKIAPKLMEMATKTDVRFRYTKKNGYIRNATQYIAEIPFKQKITLNTRGGAWSHELYTFSTAPNSNLYLIYTVNDDSKEMEIDKIAIDGLHQGTIIPLSELMMSTVNEIIDYIENYQCNL